MEKIHVNILQNSYNIFIENNLLSNIGIEIQNIYKGEKLAVVTDSNLDKIYGEKLFDSLVDTGFMVHKIVIPAGEKSKSFRVLEKVYEELISFGINRGSMILALGGGVVGDLTGFAASTFLRGIPYIHIPTSLLAQVDSSIGGKVAVDLPQGKNLVGSFYQPKAVFIDPMVLETLPDKFLYDGMGEVIKYGAFKDRELYKLLLKVNSRGELLKNIGDIIKTCCLIKRDIVERDEKDIGDRMVLNFGHTIGHAIEKIHNYEVFSHGEAISIGMYAITKKSEELGISAKGTSDSLKKIFQKYKLPTSFPGQKEAISSIISSINGDKKNIGNKINIILLNSIGEGFIKSISQKEINDYISLDY
jgi:3-dehydroquinate synthase